MSKSKLPLERNQLHADMPQSMSNEAFTEMAEAVLATIKDIGITPKSITINEDGHLVVDYGTAE